MIQSQVANGWTDVAIAKTLADASAILKLSGLVAERQRDRVAKFYPELSEAGEQLAKRRRWMRRSSHP